MQLEENCIFFPHKRRVLLHCWHPKETPPTNKGWPGLTFKNCRSRICSLTLLTAQVFQASIPAAVAPERLVGCHSYRGTHLPRTCCASRRTAPIPHSLQPLLGTQEEVYLASREALQEPTAEPTARKCSAFVQEIKPDSPIASTNGSASLLQSVSRKSLHPL